MALVSEAMNRSLVSVPLESRMADAVALVRRTGAEHVLVLEEENLVGILCACDLRGARPEEPVGERMTLPVVTVRPDADVEEAAATMCERRVGCLPVTCGGLLLGTVSDLELSRAGVRDLHPCCQHVHRRARRLRH